MSRKSGNRFCEKDMLKQTAALFLHQRIERLAEAAE
jgi:hypothetical protein